MFVFFNGANGSDENLFTSPVAGFFVLLFFPCPSSCHVSVSSVSHSRGGVSPWHLGLHFVWVSFHACIGHSFLSFLKSLLGSFLVEVLIYLHSVPLSDRCIVTISCLWWAFHFLNGVFWRTEVFILMNFSFSAVFFCLVLSVSWPRSLSSSKA